MEYPAIDPVALQLGPLAIHWYGLMYLFGFAGAWALARWRVRSPDWPLRAMQVDDLLFYGALGAILGGRIGYMLFYQPGQLLDSPLSLFAIWDGGMSFHGGLLGVLATMAFYARRQGLAFFTVTDFIAPFVPIGLFFGRIGNFINAELWGGPTDLPWGMVFPGGGPAPRHPSMLYEAALEGLVLFILLWVFSMKPRPRMAVSGLFLAGYGTFRFAVEFVREPDAHIGYLAGDWLTMGHLLSAPMILAGIGLLFWAYRRGIMDRPVDTQPTARPE
ncbi:prolipoprotein diacylglyceryl transferase [Guyparkeria halopsychrophila]|uniref:prolipoprotein diacylglyceryl transferase n=1 Tax=Guyparkeria halopsychrophila TaxID=3139421 RepID=UPI0037C759D3